MNRMVNCPNDVLVDLCHDDTWYEIIKERNHVRIPDKNPIDLSSYVRDQPKNEWEILDRDGVRIHDNIQFVKEAAIAPKLMLKHPSDLYVYTDKLIRPDEVASQYGVLAATNSKKNAKCLKRGWHYDTVHGVDYSWREFLEKFHSGATPPSNSLVIVDRYLFAYNSEYKTDYRNGIRNVYDLLSELLPPTFAGDYQVLIVFDDTAISNNASRNVIVRDLQTIKKNLGRPYTITVEVLTINDEAKGGIYAETHDRRILSNYFSLHASHGFSAFLPDEGLESVLICHSTTYATWSQRLTFESIFAGIDNEDQDMTSLPIRTNENTLAQLRQFIEAQSGNHHGFHYYCDEKPNLDIERLKNRLIRN